MQHAHDPIDASTTATNVTSAVIGALATSAAIFVLGRASDTFEQHLAMVLVAVSITVLVIWFAPGARSSARIWAIGGIVLTLAMALLVGGARSQPTKVNEDVVMAGATKMEQPEGAMAKDDDAMMAKDPEGAMAKDDTAMMAKDPEGAMVKDDTAMVAKDVAPTENVLLASGSFERLEHDGTGTASIIRTTDGRNVLTLTGFSTDAGPDLDVRLVAGNPSSDEDVESGTSVRLGKLKGTSGDQQYVLPADVDPADFTHVYVWCRAFSVGFMRAALA